MALFSKTDQRPDYASNVTTLAAGCRFNGRVDILCALHIDGEFDGNITSTSSVTIGKNGVVKSELKADKLVIAGKFIGSAECEVIELVDGGRVEGKLTAVSLAIDSGGIFQGESVRKSPSAAAKKLAHATAAPTEAITSASTAA